MKTIKIALAAGLFALTSMSAALACPDHDKSQAADSNKAAPNAVATASASFRVDGMHCAGCADEIKASLAKAKGVVTVDVKVADHRVVVGFQKDKISAEQIAKIISEAGFKASAEA